MVSEDAIRAQMRDYYGRHLRSRHELQTNVCCSTGTMTTAHQEILREIAPEIRGKFYGCGSPIPPMLENCTVLDLGCGTSRDRPGGFVKNYIK